VDIGVSVLCPGPVATDILARTRAMQPGQDTAIDRSGRMTNALANGVPPDAVGRMVLDAVRTNRLYIHTDRIMIRPIQARTAALLDAMPAEA
jgi:hypothetical protein